MTEEWLVEAGLSLTPRANMVNLKDLRGMPCASSAPWPRQPAAPTSEDLDRPGNSEPDRPRKKPKIGTSKMSESTVAREAATQAGGVPGG
ncbi:unnamed protein product, partial [Musa hybrid cultivar]